MLKGLTSHPIESVRMWASRMIAGYESRIDHEIEYEEEQKELFSQYKQDLKSIAAGQGLWLSSKALAVVLVVFELLLVVVGVVVYYWTRSKCT